MDYKKHYDNLMSSRMLLKKERIIDKKRGGYYEGHHILPKCKGGLGTSSKGYTHNNIVLLTAREHFIAHWFLWRIYMDRQMALAFHKMISNNKNQSRIISSRGYQEAREAFSITNKGNQYGKNKKGKKLSDEQKMNISMFMKGRWTGENNPFYGKNHSVETIEKLSQLAKKRCNESSGTYKGIKLVIKDGVIIAEFKKSKEVSEFIGCSYSNVRHVLSGKQKTANGYVIRYKNEFV
jgi:hypothetical protein